MKQAIIRGVGKGIGQAIFIVAMFCGIYSGIYLGEKYSGEHDDYLPMVPTLEMITADKWMYNGQWMTIDDIQSMIRQISTAYPTCGKELTQLNQGCPSDVVRRFMTWNDQTKCLWTVCPLGCAERYRLSDDPAIQLLNPSNDSDNMVMYSFVSICAPLNSSDTQSVRETNVIVDIPAQTNTTIILPHCNNGRQTVYVSFARAERMPCAESLQFSKEGFSSGWTVVPE